MIKLRRCADRVSCELSLRPPAPGTPDPFPALAQFAQVYPALKEGLAQLTEPATSQAQIQFLQSVIATFDTRYLQILLDMLASYYRHGENDPQRGWNLAREAITGPVQVVNVAHHGSEGAHRDGHGGGEQRADGADACLNARKRRRAAIRSPGVGRT